MKLHQSWTRFEEDVNYILPVAVRMVAVDPQQVECNWMNTYSVEFMAKAQEEDLSRVRKWVTDDDQPTPTKIRRKGPALRSYWLAIEQFALHRGVLCYQWEDTRDGPYNKLMVHLRLRIVMALPGLFSYLFMQ